MLQFQQITDLQGLKLETELFTGFLKGNEKHKWKEKSSDDNQHQSAHKKLRGNSRNYKSVHFW